MKSKNNINVNGDSNSILKDVNKSRILINSDKKKDSKSGLFWTILGVVITAIALLIQAITGWKDILTFLK